VRIDTQAQRVIWSASDLKAAAECEFAWCRAIDAKLGRVPAVDEPEDATLARAALLGDVHERNVLARYLDDLGADRVHLVEKVSSVDAVALAAAVEETVQALGSDAVVVFQAAFATPEFVGFADFLKRDDDGRWRVQDSKLARKARVTALMQLAAYVDQLDRLGIPRSDEVDLILGDGSVSTHSVDDLLPLFQVRRARLRALIADRRIDDGSAGAALAWGDDRGDLEVVACGRCATCEEQVIAHRDLLMVARMRPVQRARLRAAGIETIDALAEAPTPPDGMNTDTFETLRAQARLQIQADADGAPTYDVHYAAAIHTLPVPSHGDIFFDFEGDPLYTEPAPDGQAHWGIDYLFGWVDNSDQYTALWAHDFAAEREAFERFLDFVKLRRAAHPGMHIYHYAPYETSHLVAMAARHGVREGEIDRLLREGVFVDLYPLVLRTVRVGTRSYSIKKLEPLYMGADVRTSDVQKGDDSIVQYVAARELAAAGEQEEADAVFADLADYNRYDCVSTRRLRNWLIDIARAEGVNPAPPDEADEVIYEPSPRSVSLLADAERAVDAGDDGQVHRIAAAAIDYFPREAKSFWVSHFQRLREPVTMWDGTRDVVRIDRASSRVQRDWSIGEGRRVMSRDIEIRGEVSPGTTLGAGAQPFALYPVPAPFDTEAPSRAVHVPHTVTVAEVLDDGYLITETAIQGQTWDELPLALTPAAPPRVVSLQGAIDEWADSVHAAAPGFPRDAATDVLRRIPPRTLSGRPLPEQGDDVIDAIVRGVLDLDRSYLAVQGPPGTGKTYTGSQVIARLVKEHGFRIGVVAQSHAIIENLLPRTAWRHSSPSTPSTVRSSAAQRGTSATPPASSAEGSISSWSTKQGSSRSRRRSPSRPERRTCCSSETRSSFLRSVRARTPSRSTPRRSAGSWTATRSSSPITATSSRDRGACIRSSRPRCPGSRTRASSPRHPEPRGGRSTASTRGSTSSRCGIEATPQSRRKRRPKWWRWYAVSSDARSPTMMRSPRRAPWRRTTSSSSRRTTPSVRPCTMRSPRRASTTSRSARSTTSRARRRWSRSPRSRRPADAMLREARSSSCCRIG